MMEKQFLPVEHLDEFLDRRRILSGGGNDKKRQSIRD